MKHSSDVVDGAKPARSGPLWVLALAAGVASVGVWRCARAPDDERVTLPERAPAESLADAGSSTSTTRELVDSAPTDTRASSDLESIEVASGSSSAALDACVPLTEPQARLACVRNAAAKATLAELAAFVCLHGDSDRALAAAALAAALLQRSTTELPLFTQQVLGQCSELAYAGDLVHAALFELEQNRPGTLADLCAAIDASWVLGEGDDKTWTRVMGKLARDGEPRAARFIETLAAGQMACGRMQYDEGLLHFSLLGRPAAELLSTAATALESPTLASHPDGASMVVLVLLEPKSWPAGDSSPALALVLRCLAEPRFAPSAALQVLSNPAAGPAGVDSTLWAAVWAKAKDVARD